MLKNSLALLATVLLLSASGASTLVGIACTVYGGGDPANCTFSKIDALTGAPSALPYSWYSNIFLPGTLRKLANTTYIAIAYPKVGQNCVIRVGSPGFPTRSLYCTNHVSFDNLFTSNDAVYLPAYSQDYSTEVLYIMQRNSATVKHLPLSSVAISALCFDRMVLTIVDDDANELFAVVNLTDFTISKSATLGYNVQSLDCSSGTLYGWIVENYTSFLVSFTRNFTTTQLSTPGGYINSYGDLLYVNGSIYSSLVNSRGEPFWGVTNVSARTTTITPQKEPYWIQSLSV